MIAFLALFRIPQWAMLSKIQRRYVWRHCVHPLLNRSPIRLTQNILSFLLIMVAYGLGALSIPPLFIGTTVLSVILIPELVELWVISQHRNDIESYIQSHESEIQSAW